MAASRRPKPCGFSRGCSRASPVHFAEQYRPSAPRALRRCWSKYSGGRPSAEFSEPGVVLALTTGTVTAGAWESPEWSMSPDEPVLQLAVRAFGVAQNSGSDLQAAASLSLHARSISAFPVLLSAEPPASLDLKGGRASPSSAAADFTFTDREERAADCSRARCPAWARIGSSRRLESSGRGRECL